MSTLPNRSELTRPNTIEWRITGRCNEECAYCYGPLKAVHPTDAIIGSILDVLVKSEVEVIRFSGGEPLTYGGIGSVIQKLARGGKRVVLSTNGLRFVELRKYLDPYLSKLNISLDGYDARTHSLCGRTPAGFEKAIDSLNSVTLEPPPYLVKVGTVISAHSIQEPTLLIRMYELLATKRVDRWKIYQYIPEGPIVDSSLRVSDDLFEQLKGQLVSCSASRTAAGHRAMDITFASAESRSGAYFIIQPFGDVIVPVGNSLETKEAAIGNVLAEPLRTLYIRWLQLANTGKHLANTSLLRRQ
jgi:MoaA/NifB/PqqE/SkfB family radical SAM enzyme